MKTLKNILFIIVITLLIISCTDTTEDLVINQKDTVENTTNQKCILCTGEGDSGSNGDDK